MATSAAVPDLAPEALADLRRSGLTDEFIKRMRIRMAVPTELPKATIGGYLIPYFDETGELLEEETSPTGYFYRVRLIPPLPSFKYWQPTGTPNHLYFPPNWAEIRDNYPFLVVTEGEKKTAAIAQLGIPAVGVSGVDSWHTVRFKLPAANVEPIRAPGGSYGPAGETDVIIRANSELDLRPVEDRVVDELPPLATYLRSRGKWVYIVYDLDEEGKIKPAVMRAAFDLGIWFTGEGVPDVRMVTLPVPTGARGKVGIDDWLVAQGGNLEQRKAALLQLLERNEWTFPVRPDLRRWVMRMLDRPRLKVTEAAKVSRAVIAGLDRRGKRFTDDSDRFYYFDRETKKLHQFSLTGHAVRELRLTSFGGLLANEFGVRLQAHNILANVADDYVTLPGIAYATPRRVRAVVGDALYVQLSDSRMARVTADSIDIVDNGTDGVLFVSGQVEPLDERKLVEHLKNPAEQLLWKATLEQCTIETLPGMTPDETIAFLTALYYLSPWFRGWRGLMLPIEIYVGEAGSGKSMLQNLRKAVITGNPSLHHLTSDLRDWQTVVANAPAIWVADNVGGIRQPLREALTNELARLVTDPDPAIELRALYTTATKVRYPVDCTFVITAIRNPLTRQDLLQRAIVVRMHAIPVGQRDGQWYQRRLRGGREPWIADHLRVSQRFLQQARVRWNPTYSSKHRLAQFEQSMLLMGHALGMGDLIISAVSNLHVSVGQTIVASNSTYAAVRDYLQQEAPKDRPFTFTARDVADWCSVGGGFVTYGNTPRLGQVQHYLRFFEENVYQLRTTLRVVPGSKKGTYVYYPPDVPMPG